MKGLMICILATVEVLGVIYVMNGKHRSAQHFLRGCLSLHDQGESNGGQGMCPVHGWQCYPGRHHRLDDNTRAVTIQTDAEGRKWFVEKGV
jgi:hypothetical protein